MFNLVSIKRMNLLTLHRPDIQRGISLTTRSNDKLLILRYINSWCIAFQYVAEKLFGFLEVDAFLVDKLVVNDGLVEP